MLSTAKVRAGSAAAVLIWAASVGVWQRPVIWGRRKIVLIIIGVLSAILILALSLMSPGSSYYLLLPVLFLAGLCLVGYQGVSYTLIGEIAGKARTGAALGLMITINAACATLGTPIFGYIVDRTGSYATAWRVGVFLTFGIVGLITLLKDPASKGRVN